MFSNYREVKKVPSGSKVPLLKVYIKSLGILDCIKVNGHNDFQCSVPRQNFNIRNSWRKILNPRQWVC